MVMMVCTITNIVLRYEDNWELEITVHIQIVKPTYVISRIEEFSQHENEANSANFNALSLQFHDLIKRRKQSANCKLHITRLD